MKHGPQGLVHGKFSVNSFDDDDDFFFNLPVGIFTAQIVLLWSSRGQLELFHSSTGVSAHHSLQEHPPLLLVLISKLERSESKQTRG